MPVVTVETAAVTASRFTDGGGVFVEVAQGCPAAGHIVEIAVVDASGVVLLDTPVAARIPRGVGMTREALAAINRPDYRDAPGIAAVAARLADIIGGRRVAAYRPGGIRAALRHDLRRSGPLAGLVDDDDRWVSVSDLRSAACGHPNHHYPLARPGQHLASVETAQATRGALEAVQNSVGWF